MNPLRSSLVGLFLLVLPAWMSDRALAQSSDPGAAKSGKPDDRAPVVVARWYGTYSHTRVTGASSMRGTFGLLLSSIGSTETGKASIVFREERNRAGTISGVVESFSWSTKLTDLHYHDSEKRIPAGEGGSGSGSFSEKDLAGEKIAPNPQQLATAQNALTAAKNKQAAAEQKVKDDEKNVETTKAKWDAALDALKKAQAAIAPLQSAFDQAVANYKEII